MGPDSKKGSPRLNSVWYKDFVTGADAKTDFSKPNWGLCIPVGAAEVKEHFGHDVTAAHTFSPDFHRRAHYMAHAKASAKDLRRARQPKPSRAFKRDTFETTMQHLNNILRKDAGLRTQKCADFSLEVLHEMQVELFNARTHELDRVYQKAADTRQMSHNSLDSLRNEHQNMTAIKDPTMLAKARDGACHEMVMWYIHHLSESAREEIKSLLTLPLLPETKHEAPVEASDSQVEAHRRYEEKVSCGICHVNNLTKASETVVV